MPDNYLGWSDDGAAIDPVAGGTIWRCPTITTATATNNFVRWTQTLNDTAATGGKFYGLWANVTETDITGFGLGRNLLTLQRDGDDKLILTTDGLLTQTNDLDNASVQLGVFQGDRATPADNDAAYWSFKLSDSAGNQDEQARITWKATTVLDGATQDGDLILSALVNNSLTTMLTLDGSANKLESAVTFNANTILQVAGLEAMRSTGSLAINYGEEFAGVTLNAKTFGYTQTVATTGNTTGFTYTGAAHTGQTANTELIDWNIDLSRTVQITAGTGILWNRAISIDAPTYAFTAADSITVAITQAINSAPKQGTNATLTVASAFVLGASDGGTSAADSVYEQIIIPEGIDNGVGNVSERAGLYIINGLTDNIQLGNTTASLDGLYGIEIDQLMLESTTNTRTIAKAAGLRISGAPSGSGGDKIAFTNAPSAMYLKGTTTFDSASGASPATIYVDDYTVTFSTTTQNTTGIPAVFWLGQPTLASSAGAMTVNTAATLYLRGAVIAGTDVTITAPYTIWTDAGVNRFDGILQQNDAIYFTQTDGIEKIDSGSDGYLDYTVGTAHRFNMGIADTDVRLEFIGTTNSGLLEWMEDEDYFRFTDSVLLSGNLIGKQGTDIASASTIVVSKTGNTFELTGTTAVNLITTTGFQDGFEITLIANESVTINHGTATAGADVTILLSGAGNFAMTANDTLTLVLSTTTAGGQAWREKNRTVI